MFTQKRFQFFCNIMKNVIGFTKCSVILQGKRRQYPYLVEGRALIKLRQAWCQNMANINMSIRLKYVASSAYNRDSIIDGTSKAFLFCFCCINTSGFIHYSQRTWSLKHIRIKQVIQTVFSSASWFHKVKIKMNANLYHRLAQNYKNFH